MTYENNCDLKMVVRFYRNVIISMFFVDTKNDGSQIMTILHKAHFPYNFS